MRYLTGSHTRVPTRAMIAALVVLSVCFASAAHGATSDFWVSFGPWSLPHASQTFDLPKFDPALGPLTQVDFILSGTAFAGTIEWDGEGGLPTDLTLGIGAEMTATGPVSLSVVTAPMQEGSTHIPDDDDDGYPPDFAGPDYFAVTGNTGSDSATQTWTSAGDLAFFTQTAPGDTFSVDVSAEDKMLIETTGGGWGVPQAVFGQVNGTATVRYHFEAIVPEPSSIALLLLGVCPAVLLRRRRPRTRS